VTAGPKDVALVPGFTRRVAGPGHHGTGDLEVQLRHGTGDLEVQLRVEQDLERVHDLFRLSYAAA
jgi:predicted transport protein